MKHNTKSTNLTLTPDIAEYLARKLSAVEKLIDNPGNVFCDVELERSPRHKSGEVFRAEMTLQVGAVVYRAEESGETIESAIDGAQEELLREFRRSKRKYVHLLRRGGQRVKEILRGLRRER
jgi:ribosomal subunit interface protein